MVTEVSADQAESFAILRRPQVQSDRLPEGLFDGGLIGQLGLNPALARRAPTQLGDVWVVPGNGTSACTMATAAATAPRTSRHAG